MVAERRGPAEMAEYMQRMGEQPVDLSAEERNLLSVAHKSAVGSRCGAWRIITSVEQKENFKGNEQPTTYATEHDVKVGTELPGVRDGILVLMDKNLEGGLLEEEERLLPIPCGICHSRCQEQGCGGASDVAEAGARDSGGSEDCAGSTGAVY